MADKKLNSVSPVTDAAYVYAETSNGETVKISKADLASVVAEQIGEGYKTRGVFADANLCTEFGYYYNTGKADNMPSDLQEDYYLTMVVLKTLFGLIQFCIGNTKATLHVRAKTNTGLWTTWKSLA